MQPGTDNVCASQERRALPQLCPFPIQGSFGFSKKEAEQNAAKYALENDGEK